MAEPVPQSQSPSAQTMIVKVRVDEWAMFDRRAGANAELMTDGLSGCVAVAIRTADKRALTHVYSGALDTFADCRGTLAEFVAKVGSKAEITDVHIMDNRNAVMPKHGMTLSDMIQRHLVDGGTVNAAAVHRHLDNGRTIAEGGFHARTGDNAAIYRGCTNTASALPLSSLRPSVASSSVPPATPHGQAVRDGLTAITRLELVGQGQGAPALVAHQDGPSARQSQPMPVETLQRHAGVPAPAQVQPGPDKSHCPIM